VEDRRRTGRRPVLPSPFPSLPKRGRVGAQTALVEPDPTIKRHRDEEMRKALRRCGLSQAADAVQEWHDFLLSTIRVDTIEEATRAVRWLVDTGRAEHVTIAYAKHAAPLIARCQAELRKWRDIEAKRVAALRGEA